MTPPTPLSLALASGELTDATKQALQKANITGFAPDSRQYAQTLYQGKTPLQGVIIRPSEVPSTLSCPESRVSIGITNTDAWLENGWQMDDLQLIETAKGNAYISLLVTKSWWQQRFSKQRLADPKSIWRALIGSVVATEYPNLAINTLTQLDIPYTKISSLQALATQNPDSITILPTQGKTESYPYLLPGICVAVVEVISTGETAKANGLIQVYNLLKAQLAVGLNTTKLQQTDKLSSAQKLRAALTSVQVSQTERR